MSKHLADKQIWLAEKALNHGKQIFAYNHIRTNQVVYSLERSLNNHASIQQLAYAGKTMVPATLRKDHWKPLYTVSFPNARQGLAAFRKLREWRKLHELSWDPKDLPELHYTPEMLKAKAKEKEDEERNGLHRTGGRRPRRTELMKQKILMITNQKANSVADLAAVLLEQEKMGQELAETQQQDQANDDRLLQEIQELWKRSQGDDVQELQKQIVATRGESEALKTAEDKAGHRASRRKLRQLENELEKISSVRNIITEARSVAVGNAEEQASTNARAAARGYDSGSKEDLPEKIEVEVDTDAIFREQLENIRNLSAFRRGGKGVSADMPLPKKGWKRKAVKEARDPVPIFTAEGVTVRWADIMNADFAAEWPLAVVHDDLGLARHVAPRLEEAPMLEIEDKHVYIDGQYLKGEEKDYHLGGETHPMAYGEAEPSRTATA